MTLLQTIDGKMTAVCHPLSHFKVFFRLELLPSKISSTLCMREFLLKAGHTIKKNSLLAEFALVGISLKLCGR